MRIVAPLHAEKPPLATPLVVGKKAFDEGRIKTIADLKGKKVAINAPGAATEYWLEKALNAGGLTSKDVEVVNIPFQNVAEALDSGAISGAMLGEPFATQGVHDGQVHVLNNSFLDGDQPTAVYYNSDWAAKHPQLAEGFMVAYLKAIRDLERGGWRDPATLAIHRQVHQPPRGYDRGGRAALWRSERHREHRLAAEPADLFQTAGAADIRPDAGHPIVDRLELRAGGGEDPWYVRFSLTFRTRH